MTLRWPPVDGTSGTDLIETGREKSSRTVFSTPAAERCEHVAARAEVIVASAQTVRAVLRNELSGVQRPAVRAGREAPIPTASTFHRAAAAPCRPGRSSSDAVCSAARRIVRHRQVGSQITTGVTALGHPRPTRPSAMINIPRPRSTSGETRQRRVESSSPLGRLLGTDAEEPTRRFAGSVSRFADACCDPEWSADVLLVDRCRCQSSARTPSRSAVRRNR